MSAASESARPDPAVGNRARTAIGWTSGGGSSNPAPHPEQERQGYETGARLGASEGEVYEATHARLPGRFAIKFLSRARGAAASAIEDFQAAAEQVSVLRHPNIAEVLELGVMPDGTPIVVMEHLDGKTLEEMLVNRGAMSVAEVLPTIRGIATGLEAAHGVKVVHREVRPDNVFIASITGYEQGFVKLLDFGLSRLNAGPSPGSNLGTTAARYLAPEQARGLNGEVDTRTDQYALAAIAYRMLSGTDAFAGNDVISVLYHIINDAPQPLTALARVDASVDAVIRKAMSKDKRLRFDSVFVFAKALEDAASGASRAYASPVAVPTPAPMRIQAPTATPGPLAAGPLTLTSAPVRAAETSSETRLEARTESRPTRKLSEKLSESTRSGRLSSDRLPVQRSEGRPTSFRDSVSERFFAEGDRKAEEGTWTAADLDDERPEGADGFDSFDHVPRRRWPMVAGLVVAAAIVPVVASLWPDWRLLFSSRPSSFWSETSTTDVVLPTAVPGLPGAATTPTTATAVPIAPAARPAPGNAPTPATTTAPAPAARPQPAARPAAPPAAPPPSAGWSQSAPPAPSAQPIAAVQPTPAGWTQPAQPVAAVQPTPAGWTQPAQPTAAIPPPAGGWKAPPAEPTAPAAAPTPAGWTQPAQPSPAAAWPPPAPSAAAPAAAPTQPVASAAWAPVSPTAPAAEAPPAAREPRSGEPANVPLRGYVWSPKERRLVPAN